MDEQEGINPVLILAFTPKDSTARPNHSSGIPSKWRQFRRKDVFQFCHYPKGLVSLNMWKIDMAKIFIESYMSVMSMLRVAIVPTRGR